MSFEKELELLINKHCKENDSDTPDFILAEYLSDCLYAFRRAVNSRDKWYGFKALSNRLAQGEIKQTGEERREGGK